MRNITLIFLLLFLGIEGFSQEVHHGKNDDLTKYLLDSVKYVLPEFAKGVVIFNNGEKSEGNLNISTIDQSLLFISPEGEILAARDNDEVSRVSIKGRSFVRSRGNYIELIKMSGDAVLSACRRVSFLETEKEGAYGKASPTTSVTSISSITDGGQRYDLANNLTTPFVYKVIPYLYRDGAFYMATKKSFQKAFPSKKKLIESYVKENRVDFENFEEVEALFNYLDKAE